MRNLCPLHSGGSCQAKVFLALLLSLVDAVRKLTAAIFDNGYSNGTCSAINSQLRAHSEEASSLSAPLVTVANLQSRSQSHTHTHSHSYSYSYFHSHSRSRSALNQSPANNSSKNFLYFFTNHQLRHSKREWKMANRPFAVPFWLRKARGNGGKCCKFQLATATNPLTSDNQSLHNIKLELSVDSEGRTKR